MTSLALALALAVSPPQGMASRLSPAPLELYRIAWMRPFVGPQALETAPLEPGGVGVDPRTGVAVFGTRDGWLHAVRPDGTVAWELRTEGASWAPPGFAGDTVFAGSSDGRLYAVELSTGKLRWRYDAKEELGTRPVIAEGTVFVMSLQDTLYAIDAQTGAWRWHHRREARTGFSIRGAAGAAVRDGVVYAGYSDGFVAALETATGKVRWERLVAPPGDYQDVDGLELSGDRLLATAFSGSVLCLDLGSGDVIWAFRAPAAVRLVADQGLVVALSGATMYGIAAASGAPLWSTPLEGGPGNGQPVRAGQWVLVPTGTDGLRFVEAASGRTFRTLDPGSGISGTPALIGSRIYALSNAGELVALDLP